MKSFGATWLSVEGGKGKEELRPIHRSRSTVKESLSVMSVQGGTMERVWLQEQEGGPSK